MTVKQNGHETLMYMKSKKQQKTDIIDDLKTKKNHLNTLKQMHVTILTRKKLRLVFPTWQKNQPRTTMADFSHLFFSSKISQMP